MESSTTHSSQDLGDEKQRNQIGPWKEGDLKSLDHFKADTNFVVRAAAGSGKTTALVGRMVGLIRKGKAEIQDLAAITFTRKAASEMQERLYEELLSAKSVLDGERGGYSGTEAEKRNVEDALARVQQCFVGTVHSFCGRILREHAFEAELPPDFAVGIDEEEEADLRAQVWDRYVADKHRSDGALDDLEVLGLQPSDLRGLFRTVSAYPELDLYTNPPEVLPDLDGAVEQAEEFVRTWQAYRPAPPLKDRDSAQKALDTAEGLIENFELDTPARKAQLLSTLKNGYSSSSEKGKVTLSAWGNKGDESYEASRDLRDRAYQSLMDSVLPALQKWRAHVHGRAIDFVKPAAKRYLKTRREEGLLMHHDVLYHTRNLLRNNPEVRREVYERTPRLLVDEFQDTDPLQAEILFYLTSEDRKERAWTSCRPRPGSLFIVGDDKQSIYRFRRADLNVYNEVTNQITETGGEEVTLTTNFRSHSQICSFCDEVFDEVFSEYERDGIQADYTEFETPDGAGGRDEHGVRRLKVDYKKGNPTGEIAEDTAEQIAGFIQRALGEGEAHEMAGPEEENPVFEGAASPKDFLIVTGGKKHLSTYGEALARAGIPFTITGSNDLGDSDDLKDFVDLLTCALRPADELAAVSYLRGGLCGFSDDDLYRVRKAFDEVPEEPFRFTRPEVPEAALSKLDSDLAERYRGASERVQRARSEVRSKRPALALSSIAEDANLLAAAAHAPPEESGSIRAGRLLRAFALVRKQAGEGDSWADVLAILQDVLDGEVEADGLTLESGSHEGSEQDGDGESDNASGGAVRIMNIHQVKGLEAPVVFLADPYPETGSRQSPTQHVQREEGTSGTLVAPITKETPGSNVVTHPPLGWEGEDGFESTEEAHENAEKKRLTYVAATRAERLLVVSEYHHKDDGRKDGDWNELSEGLENTPLLSPDLPEEADSDRPAPDLDRHRVIREDAIERSRMQSYRVTNVSEELERTSDSSGTNTSGTNLSTERAEGEDTDGYGKVLGLAVHAVLETLVREGVKTEEVSTSQIRGALQDAREQVDQQDKALGGASEDLTARMVDTAQDMVSCFLSSPLASRVKTADQVYAEHPVSSAGESDPVTVERGVIDLVYRDEEGWHIVDYKTDRIDEDEFSGVGDDHKYARQVRRYADVWESVIGESVADATLWFADMDATVSVR
ncbi:UvrD-helicase domain-containing protein [Salinibacter sp.]|uniref:UvrD-helicase domain-containing protein n=1 Tax=Salinibacter sp. TaxID=2065818 RepID=UPI0021E8381E|nr:UvrD-helicase domain-containing protein [Salinibacter sp.]